MNSQDLLLEMAKNFDADFENGVLYWVKPKRGKKEAGTLKPALKRVYVSFKNKEYLRYRILFALHHGHWPFGEIDHIDGNQSNDKLSNLRDVSHLENTKNCKLRVDNKFGCPGISFHQGKWRVRIGSKHKDSFETLEAAIAYRKKMQAISGYTERHGT